MDDNEKATAQAANGAALYIDAAATDRVRFGVMMASTPPDYAKALWPATVEIAATLARLHPQSWAQVRASLQGESDTAILDELDPDND